MIAILHLSHFLTGFTSAGWGSKRWWDSSQRLRRAFEGTLGDFSSWERCS